MAPGARSSQQVIDEALTEAQRRADVHAARARVGMLGTVALLAVLLRIFGDIKAGPIPALWIACYLGFALVTLWYVAKFPGRGPGFAVTTHSLDLLFAASYAPVIMSTVPEYLSDAEARQFALFLVPNSMLLCLAVSAERGNPRVSIYLGVLASVLVITVLSVYGGFHYSQFYVAAIFLLTGLSGLSVARRSRRMVEMVGRLEMLKAFVPDEVHEKVVTDPNAAFAVGGETYTLTILVADLRGFTTLAEKLPPDEVVAQLNAFHTAMLEVVHVHGGKLDKFLGDGALVVFGLDQATGRSTGRQDFGAHAAVSCARGMLRALSELNEERDARGLDPLEMGIGIHTGRVVAGNIGVPEVRLEWTVIGDAVNTAARIQGACRELRTPVIISAETASHLPDTSGLQAVAPLSVKGREAKVPVFALGGAGA